ncbi:hypothetical protein ACFVXQ_08805 [Kitasatospora sp. NPDC058263]
MTIRGQGPDGPDGRPSAEQVRQQQYEDDPERADQAAAVAQAFRTALESARAAGIRALPEGEAAA